VHRIDLHTCSNSAFVALKVIYYIQTGPIHTEKHTVTTLYSETPSPNHPRLSEEPKRLNNPVREVEDVDFLTVPPLPVDPLLLNNPVREAEDVDLTVPCRDNR
jgi:hypothetical protein